VRFLVDAALSPRIAEALRKGGHEAAHVRDRGLQSATDGEILKLAATEECILVSADTDFGAMLAATGEARPSVILFRGQVSRQPERQAAVLLANLQTVRPYLERGAVAVIEASRVRLRELPIGRKDDRERADGRSP